MRTFTRFLEHHGARLALASTVASAWLLKRLIARLSPVELPEPTGPFPVGRGAFDAVDMSREDAYRRGKSRKRELSVWLWYPAEPVQGVQAGEYLPGRWRITSRLWRFQPSRIRAHAIPGAPVARTPARFPVLVFSPSAFAPHYFTALFEELASHGYIVAAVSHPYEMLPVSVFADGRVRLFRPASVGGALFVSKAPHEEDVSKRAKVVDMKAEDLRFVVDQLEHLNTGSGWLAGRMDLERLGAFGHSMGGNAAVELCRRDRRCRAVVDLDGGVWSQVSQEGVSLPLMMLFAEHPEYVRPCADSVRQKIFSSEEYCRATRQFAVEGWQRLYSRAQPGYSLQARGAGHASFTDCGLLPLKRVSFARRGVGPIDAQRMWRVLSTYLRAFFGQHLVGKPSVLLEGPSPEYPEVVFGPPAALFRSGVER